MSNNINNYEAIRTVEDIDWDKCPESVRVPLEYYFEHHVQTGGFLYAVLTNDLYSACGRADSTNRECLFDIVQFLYNEVPSMCYGSPKKVGEWLHHE